MKRVVYMITGCTAAIVFLIVVTCFIHTKQERELLFLQTMDKVQEISNISVLQAVDKVCKLKASLFSVTIEKNDNSDAVNRINEHFETQAEGWVNVEIALLDEHDLKNRYFRRLYTEDSSYSYQIFEVKDIDGQVIEDYGSISSEFIRYCVKAILDENVEDSLAGILTDYEEIDIVERIKLLLKKGSGPYLGMNNEIWYSVQLSNSKENNGKDVVVCCEENGHYVIYVFENVSGFGKQYELMGKGGGQEYSTPYFVSWSGQNFMVVPYWNETGKRIVGMSIYDFTSRYTVLTIGIRDNSEAALYGQMYESGGAAEYPKVYLDAF